MPVGNALCSSGFHKRSPDRAVRGFQRRTERALGSKPATRFLALKPIIRVAAKETAPE